MADPVSERHGYRGPAFFSYGFRPFFLGAALFAGVAIPAWTVMLAAASEGGISSAPREWHVHEMVFGFLPAVITGFMLTAIPNWTDRDPIRGKELIVLFIGWLAGRLVMAMSSFSPVLAAIVDVAFLVAAAGLVWREIAAGKSWSRTPMGVLISLYAGANVLFHVLALSGEAIDLPVRMALALVMVLLALIGGRVTPSFTEEYLVEQRTTERPTPFSRLDGVSIVVVAVGAVAWTVRPQATATGGMLLAAGLINAVRLFRWRGWATWREPLVLVLHLGYGWLAIALIILGSAILQGGLSPEDAVHALTTGAVGVMTLAVMTRASLGHTGRLRHAGPITVAIYLLVTLGALLRVFVTMIDLPATFVLGVAAVAWSGAYVLFAVVYGPFLLRQGLDEQGNGSPT